MPPPDAAAAAGSFRRDLVSAYAATIARVASWLVISALAYRISPAAFAFLALVRATVGLLNYTTLGLGPALIHSLAGARRGADPAPDAATASAIAAAPANDAPPVLSYETARRSDDTTATDATRSLYANGLAVAGIAFLFGAVL